MHVLSLLLFGIRKIDFKRSLKSLETLYNVFYMKSLWQNLTTISSKSFIFLMFNFYSLSNERCMCTLFKLEEKESGKYYEDESVRNREREKRKK